ncbi:TetR/AcrR family transcriptional regulator [Ruegeria sp.]|uniref:TetR/AcrR family transcriptional regulator n=1 Tax=Ruegeria sp. TaxID=1879320 RepID=UPI003B00F5B8
MPKIVDVDEKRNLIAQSACRVVVAKGVANTRMADIAAEANVTTGMIVNYFNTKDEIIAAALRLAFRNIEAKIAERTQDQKTTNLFAMLEPVIGSSDDDRADVAVWINFWGMLSADPELRELNQTLHKEGLQTYKRAMLTAWPESAEWPDEVFDAALTSVVTCLFGLSAGGIVNPTTWPKTVLRTQLRMQLDLVRDWSNAQPNAIPRNAQNSH